MSLHRLEKKKVVQNRFRRIITVCHFTWSGIICVSEKKEKTEKKQVPLSASYITEHYWLACDIVQLRDYAL